MNKLLNPISWSAYLETVAVLAIIYYAYIGWKYYRPEIEHLIGKISGKTPDEDQLPEALRYPEEESRRQLVEEPAKPNPATYHVYHEEREVQHPAHHEPTPEVRELANQLSECIAYATDKPFAPAVLIPKLKKILNDYPDIAATIDRDEINALIVRECERTGTALLSESEVDMWWSA